MILYQWLFMEAVLMYCRRLSLEFSVIPMSKTQMEQSTELPILHCKIRDPLVY